MEEPESNRCARLQLTPPATAISVNLLAVLTCWLSLCCGPGLDFEVLQGARGNLMAPDRLINLQCEFSKLSQFRLELTKDNLDTFIDIAEAYLNNPDQKRIASRAPFWSSFYSNSG